MHMLVVEAPLYFFGTQARMANLLARFSFLIFHARTRLQARENKPWAEQSPGI